MLGQLVRDEDVLHTVITYVDDGHSLARFSLASRACFRVATDDRLWKAICSADTLCALAQVFEQDVPQSSAWLHVARQQYEFPTVDTLALELNGWRSFFSNRHSYARVAALLRGTQGHWFYAAQAALKERQAQFAHPIPGPLCLELAVADPVVAALVHVQLLEGRVLSDVDTNLALTLIAKSQIDYERLAVLADEVSALSQVKFEHTPWDEMPTHSCPTHGAPGVSEQALRDYGLLGNLLSYIHAHPGVLKYLGERLGFDRILLGSVSTTWPLVDELARDPRFHTQHGGGEHGYRKQHILRRVWLPGLGGQAEILKSQCLGLFLYYNYNSAWPVAYVLIIIYY
jgi:hypothetical protein